MATSVINVISVISVATTQNISCHLCQLPHEVSTSNQKSAILTVSEFSGTLKQSTCWHRCHRISSNVMTNLKLWSQIVTNQQPLLACHLIGWFSKAFKNDTCIQAVESSLHLVTRVVMSDIYEIFTSAINCHKLLSILWSTVSSHSCHFKES